jgi:hypothetical protein
MIHEWTDKQTAISRSPFQGAFKKLLTMHCQDQSITTAGIETPSDSAAVSRARGTPIPQQRERGQAVNQTFCLLRTNGHLFGLKQAAGRFRAQRRTTLLRIWKSAPRRCRGHRNASSNQAACGVSTGRSCRLGWVVSVLKTGSAPRDGALPVILPPPYGVGLPSVTRPACGSASPLRLLMK